MSYFSTFDTTAEGLQIAYRENTYLEDAMNRLNEIKLGTEPSVLTAIDKPKRKYRTLSNGDEYRGTFKNDMREGEGK